MLPLGDQVAVEPFRYLCANLAAAEMGFHVEIAFTPKLAFHFVNRTRFRGKLEGPFNDVHSFHAAVLNRNEHETIGMEKASDRCRAAHASPAFVPTLGMCLRSEAT